jgi:hypothetical protein
MLSQFSPNHAKLPIVVWELSKSCAQGCCPALPDRFCTVPANGSRCRRLTARMWPTEDTLGQGVEPTRMFGDGRQKWPLKLEGAVPLTTT